MENKTDIIRNESAHAINGVLGRLHTLRRPPAQWKAGTFANQTWVSESRPVKGYGTMGRMTVNVRFDDQCRNGHNTFSITAEVTTNESRRRHDIAAGGCLHDEIEEVFPELSPLIKWHLCSTDGPMHYVENTIYHAKENSPTHAWVYFTGQFDPLGISEEKERLLGYLKAEKASKAEGVPGYRIEWDHKTAKVRNLDHARSSAVWYEATDEQLCADPETLRASLESRLPALLDAFRMSTEGAGFTWACPAEEV